MCCNKCFLRKQNLDSLASKELLKSSQKIFRCRLPICGVPKGEAEYCSDCLQKSVLQVCPHDVWVLTFLGISEANAVETACYSLDTFVHTGNAELLCELFRLADYETRKELWFRMTSIHANRLYLLNELFEKEELPPIKRFQAPTRHFAYQSAILAQRAI
jgi:hypothetical protein